MIAGALVVDKPRGPTSHDIVALARRALGERRIGHCGTLDPMATGVLALAVGPATRLVQFLAAESKHYEATIRFGSTTTTYDAMGDLVSTSPVRPSRSQLDAALAGFVGSFAQRPPAFSAKKVGGVRAYHLARRGRAADMPLPPVTVTVDRLTVLAFDGHRLVVSLAVSSGFYVRSLAHDLGEVVGAGAHLEALRRTRAGSFTLEDAVPMDELAGEPREGLHHRLIPTSRLLPDVPAVLLSADDLRRVRHGMDVALPPDWSVAPPLARLLDDESRLAAVAVPAERPGFLHPSVVLG